MDITDNRPRRRPLARRALTGLSGAALVTALVTPAVAAPASAVPTSAVPTSTTSSGRPPGRAAALDAAAREVVAAGAVGYLAHVRDGRRVVTARAGQADRATGRRIGADDQFEIGSNTKTFTAVLVLQMVARGQLSLDDRIEQHLPGLVPGGDRITVRRILNHTSGIFNYTADKEFMASVTSGSDRLWTPVELVRVAVKHDPDFAPGQGWNYSNTNYVIAGMIAEKVSGHRLADLVAHRIAGPLGLRRTYLVTDTIKKSGPGFAHGYSADLSGPRPVYTDVTGWPLGGWAGAAGAVVSTPSELATFYSALMRGRIVPARQLAQMRTLVTPSKQWRELGVEGYGLGLMKTRTPCGLVWGHGGDTLGHHSTAVVTADGRAAAVTDTTTQPSAAGPGAEKLAAASGSAETVATCLMLGRPAPRS